MSNPVRVKEWIEELKCKECNLFKSLLPENRYKHSQWYKWVLWRCKVCIKEWRKTDHELNMSRERDRNRYYNDEKRNCYIKKSSKKRREKIWYGRIHLSTSRRVKKLWIRPKICPICNKKHSRIESHHFDYMQPWKIIFACSICHSKLDRWIISHNECEIIDIEPTHYKSKVKWIKHKPYKNTF